MGAWKRLGKRSATGTSASSSLPRGVRGLGVGDGTVAIGATTIGDGRGAAGMSSVVVCS